jgi:Spy/CpxP family protein refolding chaperone
MKNKFFKFVLILSLLLNFSFLGAAGYTHYKRSHPPVAASLSSDPRTSYLFQKLSLKPEQIKLFQQKASSFHDLLSKNRQEVAQLRKSLIGFLRADNLDQRAIDATIVQINSRQQDTQQMVVAHMLEFKSLLNQDQQKKFLDLVEGAMAKRNEVASPACP